MFRVSYCVARSSRYGCGMLGRFAYVATLMAISAAKMLAQGPATITFIDTFATRPSPLWNNLNGNWAASDGKYYAQTPNDSPLTYTGLPFDIADYRLTVTTVVGDGGIWLRSDERDPYADYILLVIGGDGYGQGLRGGNSGTSLYFATQSESGINQVDNVFTPGETYTITVTAEGGTYSVYINGATTPVDTFVDTSFVGGQVGLYDDQPNTTNGNGSGTPTTFSNFGLTGIALPPTVTVFSPGGGVVGSAVKIAGRNLQLATAVAFNGTPAKFAQAYPSAEIVAIVPDSATTGQIQVTTPVGIATSLASFTVLP